MNARALFLTTWTLLGGALPGAGVDTAPRFVGDEGDLVLFEHDGSPFDRNTPEGDLNVAPRQRLIRELIRTHGDFYDFVVVFTNFDFDRGGAIGFYTNVRNDVQGIGLPVVDNGDSFGSPGRLQGLIDMGPIDQYRQAPFALEPGTPGFRTTLGILAHELGHRWLVGVRFHDGATLRNDLLGKDDAHWSFLLSSEASFLYGNNWEDIGGGSFRSVETQTRFNELDLYLMGFLEPENVSPLTLLVNPDVDPERLPELSAVVSNATVQTVTLDQIVVAEGPRMPSYQSAQKDFNVAFVFLSGLNLLPTERDLEAVEDVRAGFADSLFALTRGHALVDADLQHVTNVSPGAEPDIALALEWLLAQQKADGRFEAHPLTAVRDTATALMAISTLGIRGPPAEDASRWLSSQAPSSVDYRARTIAAGVPLLTPPLESLQNPDGGFGLAPGYRSDPLDTALALAALHQTGASEDLLSVLTGVLVSMQLGDGSWSAIAGQPGDVLTTSEAVRALALAGGPESAIASALGWLVDRQELAGGLGDGPATPYATALTLEAFLLGTVPSSSVDRAVTYLQKTQRPDGSWGESVFETASVLRALVPSTFANLSIEPSDVDLSVDPPEVGETVAIDVTVRDRSRVAAGPFDVQLFDGDPEAGGIALGPPRLFEGLPAGGTVTASFTWDTSGLEGPHALYAIADFAGAVAEVSKEDNVAVRNVDVLPPLPNLVVSLLTLEPTRPIDGTSATVRARVENRGSANSTATLLRAFREVPRLGIVLGEAAVPALAPAASVEIPVEWSNAGPVGSHTLHVVVDPDDTVRERLESDNETTLDVDVRTPPPAQPDLEIEAFVLVPDELEALPQIVTASARVANTGLDPVPSALVELFQGNPELGGVLVASGVFAVPGDDRIDLSFDFEVTSGGTRTYYLRVDPGGVVERDPENNLAFAVLRDRMDVIDVTLVPGSIVPSTTVLDPGDTLFVDVQVRNRGTRTLSSVAVALFYEVAAGGAMRRASIVNLPLEPGASATVTLSWRANRSGTVPLELRADPDDVLAESNEADNVLSTSVDVTDSTLPNLTLASSDIVATPDLLLEGGSATLEARVVNLGAGDAGAFDVRFFAGDPNDGGRLIGETSVPTLAPSSGALASVAWDPIRARGEVLVYVAVDAARIVEEIDEEDNVAFRVFDVDGLPDLLSTSASVRLTPAFPRSGESVTMAASFTNAGGQPSTPMAIEVRLDDPDGGALVASSEIDTLLAGESSSFEGLWDTSGIVGEHSLYLVLDVRDDVLEQREDNNVIRVPVALQDADVFVTPLYFSPNGDGVQDEAVLFFRLQSSEELRVEVRNGEERVLRDLGAGLSPNASVVWNGRDDRGVLAPDGAYSFVVLGGEDVELLRRRVVLDTNRSGIVEALGTDRVSFTQLTCELPDRLSGPAWLPSDRAAYFIVNREEVAAPDFPVGLYRVSSDGRDTELVLADDGFNDVFFIEYAAWLSFQRLRAVSARGDRALVRSSTDLEILDLETGARMPLGVGREAMATWTPEGERALVASPSGLQFYDHDGTLLQTLVDANVTVAVLTTDRQRIVYRRREELVVRVIDVNGSGDRVLESTEASALYGLEVSADDLDLGDLYALRDDDRVVFHWYVNTLERDAGPFLLDLDADAHEPYPFDDELSSDGRWELVRAGGLLHAARRYRGREIRPILPTSDGFSLHWSYRDTHLSFRAPGGDGCVGDNGIWALRTFDNGEAELRLTRLPSSFGIRITGTASDRNLESYALEFAPVATPDRFTAIEPPSSVPVLADILTTWIPPAPGDYLVRLTVRDLAGNETVRLERIFWDETPPIASLRRSPSYLSPNGDGRQDELLVQYDVLAPVNLVFHVRDEEGRSLRAIARDESAPGPASFVWDGRDDAGQPIDDGRYVLEVLGAELAVFVDQTPPDVAVHYTELYTNIAEESNPKLAVDLEGHILEARLDRWELVGPDGEILNAEAREVGTENEDAIVLERLRPVQGLELRTYDLAGNETVIPLVGPSREVRVLKVSADPIGPFEPGPPQTIAQRAIRPDGFFTASAAASFVGELRFFYHAEGEATFNEIPTTRSVALRADELSLGTRYVGHFESDGVSSEPVAFTVGPEVIFLEAFSGPVTSWVLTNTIEEPLVEGRLLRTMGGVTQVLRTFAPVPDFAEGSDGTPPCGTVGLYRVEATGLSGTRYYSTTPEAYPNASPDGVRGSACLSVQDAGIEAQRSASDPVPTEATALIVNDLLDNPPETLFLSVNGTEVGSVPGDIGSVRIPFDTGGLSEDRYTLTTRATLSSGETIDGNFGLSFFLDQSPPEITILSPVEGGNACVVTENGRELVALDVIVHDRQIDTVGVEMLLNGSWKALGLADPLQLPQAGGLEVTLRAILPEGIEGTQAFRVVARSRRIVEEVSETPPPNPPARSPLPTDSNNGGLVSATPRTFVLSRALGLGPLATEPEAPALFSPNDDDNLDEIRVRGEAREAVSLTARVYTVGQPSALVRTLVSDVTQPIGPFELVWDGRDDMGLVVTDGAYEVEVEVVNGCGGVSSAQVRVSTDTTVPTVAIENLVEAQPVSIGVEVVGTADDPHLEYFVLEAGEGAAPVSFVEVAPPVLRRVVSRVLGNWSVGDLAPGPHTLRLTAVDTVGNRASTRVTVDVVGADFIALHRADPPLFSPNGDAQLDETEISFDLEGEARVSLEIRDANDDLVASLLAGEVLTAGPRSLIWDGTGLPGLVPDGEYDVLLRAEDPLTPTLFEESRVTLIVDTTPPDVAIASPVSDGFLSLPDTVSGSVDDDHLDRYTIEIGPAIGAFTTLAEDSLPATGTLASLRALEDGSYRLRASASDQAGNRTELTIAFEIDSTPPVLHLSSPADRAFLSKTPPVVDVSGQIEESNLERFDLDVGFGDPPNVFVPLAGGVAPPPSSSLATWDLDALPDGDYTLRLSASDKASNFAVAETRLTLDTTAPTVVLESPADGDVVADALSVRGTLDDANFQEGTLSVAPAEQPLQLTEVASFEEPRISALLAESILLADGDYLLELRAIDRSGNPAATTLEASVDTLPPDPPSNLAASVEGGDVTLRWDESPSSDVVGYHVSRDGIRITTVAVPGTSFVDTGRPEGRYRYHVVAVDRAELESEPTEPATALVDLTPPNVALHAPDDGEHVRIQVDVVGTAFSENDFFEYRLSVASAETPDHPTLLKRSGVVASFDTLFQWQALVDGDFVLTLEAEDTHGNVSSAQVQVTVDNEAPGAPVLVRAQAAAEPDDVEIEWEGPSDTDVEGFLVYRNGRLANAPGNVSGSLRPFLVPGPVFSDLDLVDGEHCYHVVAMDLAGNLSNDSNELCVFLDNRAPAAVIFDPENGARFDASRAIRASTEDEDIATVDFEFQRAGEITWTRLGSDRDVPFEIVWDVSGLDFGDYRLRAIATDIGTRSDPAPVAIDVVLGDVTPPSVPFGLAAQVTGDAVALGWEAVTDTDLGGYRIYRDGILVLEPGSSDTTATDAGVADGIHDYAVSSVDLDGNESEPSESVAVRVYALVLLPDFPVLETAQMSLSGKNAEPGAALRLYEVGNPSPLAQATADPGGTFAFSDVTLSLGPHLLEAEAEDTLGNVSRRSDQALLIRNERPAAPGGLQAIASGDGAEISWDGSAEPELSGYLVRRDGELLNPRGLLRPSGTIPTGVTATASTSPSTARNVIDGTFRSWNVSSNEEQWVELTLDAPRHLDEIRLLWSFNRAAKDYDLLAELEGRLAPILRVRDNAELGLNSHSMPIAIRTRRVRVQIFSGVGPFGVFVNELELIGIEPETTTTFTDVPATPGFYDYTSSVIDMLGSTSDEAGPVNLGVGDLTPPEPPTALDATVIDTDVWLSWTASVSDDVVRYRIFRDSVAVAEVTTTSYVDRDRLNGIYTYYVIALDGVGNLSDPSNPAEATVDVAPPEAPVLTLSVPPEGGALSLSWTESVGPLSVAEYVVLRASTSGGPYTEVARLGSTARSFVDRGLALTNGVELFYVVRAVDLRGQSSDDSNEVSGTPEDVAPPPPPIWYAPTTSGVALAVTASRTSLVGLAEPGSEVDVARDDVSMGTTAASQSYALVANTFLGSPDNVAGRFAISPDRRFVAEVGSGYSWNFDTEVRLFDLASGDLRAVPYGTGPSRAFERGVAFSPSGRRIAVATTIGTDTLFALRILDLESETTDVMPLAEAPQAPAWISDEEVALVIGDAIVVYDLAGDTENTLYTSVSGFTPERLSVSLDRAYLAWRESDELLVMPSHGGSADLVVRNFALDEFLWSGSRRLAYTLFEGLHLYDVDSGTSVLVPDTEGIAAPRSLGIEGVLSAFRGSELVWLLPDGTVVDLGEVPASLDLDFVEWSSDLAIAGTGEFLLRVLETPGRFALEGRLVPGLNRMTARARDAEGNESLDSEAIEVTFDDSLLADLAFDTPLSVIPAAPLTGQSASLAVSIVNQGQSPSEPSVVSVTGSDLAGNLYTIGTAAVPALAPGAQTGRALSWSTMGRLGAQSLVATLDPLELLDEADETNNQIATEATVVGSAALELTIAAGREQYAADQNVELTISAVNGGSARNVVLETIIEDGSGAQVALVDTRFLNLDHASETRYAVFWNTGSVIAGTYVARVRTAGGETASAPFEITRTLALSLATTSDRASYRQGDDVGLLAEVANLEGNTPLRDLSVRFRILDPSRQTIFETSERPGYLAMGGSSSVASLWRSGAVATGSYALVAEAFEASELIASAEASFLMEAASAVVLRGALELDEAAVPAGGTLVAGFAIDNEGVVGLDDGTVRVELVDPNGPNGPVTMASTEAPLVVAAGATSSGQLVLDTNGLALGRYAVVLSANASALDSTPATLFATPAPPSLNAPANGASAPQRLLLSVNNASNPNDESLTYEFELYLDSGLTTRLGAASGLPEGPSTTAWAVLQFLQENRHYYWRARAADRFATSDWMAPAEVFVNTTNEPPEAPTLSEPAEGAEVASLLPALVIGNALDPEGDASTYTFEIYRGLGMTDLVERVEGVVEGSGTTSFTPSADLEEDQTYTWRARANDGELDSPWMAEASFRVNTANQAPSAPEPIAPNGVDVPTLSPELLASIAVDPENDALTYSFQIDLREAFDSSSRQESLPLVEPRWTPPSALEENGEYFWRVRGSDGIAVGPWSETARFRVDVLNEPPEAPTPQRPADRSFVESVTPVLAVVNATDPEEDALTYRFEVYEDEALNAMVASIANLPQGVSETAWEISPRLEEGKTYYWRALANDGTSNGPFSSPQSFVVNTVNAEPGAPTLVAPAVGSNVADLAPELVVANAVDPDGDALTYRFEVYADELLTELVEAADVPEGAGETSFTMSAALEENHLYYWRARATDGLLDGPWMDTARFRFSVGNEPPTSPVPEAPADQSSVAVLRPTLVVANAIDPEEDTLRYRFFVYRDTGLTELVAASPDVEQGSPRTSWQVTLDLDENKTYFWRALATDGDLESPPSDVFQFTVNTVVEPPSVPVLVSPADGSSIATTTPSLVIDNATSPDGEALHYHVALYADEVLTDLLVENDAVAENASGQTSWEPPVTLDSGSTYFWRARAIDARGLVSDWASSFRFTVEPPSSDCPPEWRDDFDGYSSGKSPGGWLLQEEQPKARFHVVGDHDGRRLSSVPTGRGSLLFAGASEAFEWRNYAVSGEVSHRGAGAQGGDCVYRTGVVFYARPHDRTAYRLELTGPHCDVPRARVVKRLDGSTHVLAEIELDRHLDDQNRPLRFRIETANTTDGTSLRVHLKGRVKKKEREWTLAYEDREAPLRAGTVGAWSNFMNASWDDFHVREIEGLESGISGDVDGDGVCDVDSDHGDDEDDDDDDDHDHDDDERGHRVNRPRRKR